MKIPTHDILMTKMPMHDILMTKIPARTIFLNKKLATVKWFSFNFGQMHTAMMSIWIKSFRRTDKIPLGK